jgi:hypothetical protein
MNTSWKNGLPWLLAALLLAVTLIVMSRLQPVQAAGKGATGSGSGPRYSVVETEGHNLIVTDNRKQMLYFYTIEKDAKIGSELKLRGQLNLKQVGKEVIKPENVHLRKQ